MEKYIYGNGLIAAECVTEEKTTEYKIYHYDIRGSVTSITNIDGTVTARYSYSTYGTRTTINGSESEIVGYCGREGVITDPNELIYMRSRYYSPELKRFINEDIVTGDISNSNSLNRYTYVEGNSIMMIDSFGLCAERTEESRKNIATALRQMSQVIDRHILTSYAFGNVSLAANLVADVLDE